MARKTNKEQQHGNLAQIMEGKDVFIGVSAPKIVTAKMVSTMAKKQLCLQWQILHQKLCQRKRKRVALM